MPKIVASSLTCKRPFIPALDLVRARYYIVNSLRATEISTNKKSVRMKLAKASSILFCGHLKCHLYCIPIKSLSLTFKTFSLPRQDALIKILIFNNVDAPVLFYTALGSRSGEAKKESILDSKVINALWMWCWHIIAIQSEFMRLTPKVPFH